ncbi:MAG: hypothetical protein WBL39_22160 [Terrimicrobiaceae bacterium]
MSAQVNGFGESVIAPPAAGRTIPFDYVFRFDGSNNELKGQPGLVHNSTVDISIEAAFTAVSIGYGVVPKVEPITFGLAPVSEGSIFNRTVAELVLSLSKVLDEFEFGNSSGKVGSRTAAVLKDGLRLNPQFADQILTGGFERDEQISGQAFQAVGAPPERVAFKYALFDQGSGREFQSEPILNIAGLGSSDGKRPFRYFARPIEFAPRSTIRLQVTEVSAFKGELHVALHGYKTLGTPGTPTAPGRARGRIRR